MWKRLTSLVSCFQSWWKFGVMLVGFAVSAGIPIWAARATAFMQMYAPASWVFAGLFGVLAFLAAAALISFAVERIARASTVKRFYRDADRINPLELMFTGRRIRIVDLVSPIEPVIRGKTFIDCEIIGPANIALSATRPGAGGINNCGFSATAAVLVKEDAVIPTVIMFVDCTFVRCKMHLLLLLMPPNSYDTVRQGIQGLPWITFDPVPRVEALAAGAAP